MSTLAKLHNHTPSQNKINTFILFAVAIPAIIGNYWLSHHCHADVKRLNAYVKSDHSLEAYLKHAWNIPWSSTTSFHDYICNMYIDHPLWMLNILFFFNVNVLFWIISLIQHSTWLIDPYWTIIPVMISHFFWSHPLAASSSSNPRALLSMILMYIWAIRLTHSYFRREEWQMGAREDWRFTDIKKQLGGLWPFASFFIVYILQHVFLVGISLPMYVILDLGTNTPFSMIDIILAAVCLLAVGMAYFADAQLFHYMNNKPSTPVPTDEDELWKSIIAGGNTNMLLNSGLWYYSRHPNYFSEQLWWWSLSFYCIHILGHTGSWYLLGPLINSICLAIVTVMVEIRINQRKERVHVYKMYRETTSPLIPLPKFTSKGLPSQRNKKEL